MDMCIITKSKHSKVSESEERGCLNNHNNGYAEHKFYVLCFVTDNEHTDEHSYRAAERGEYEKGLFGDSELYVVFLRYDLVIYANEHGYQRNCRDIYSYYRPYGIFFEKFYHNKNSFFRYQ